MLTKKTQKLKTLLNIRPDIGEFIIQKYKENIGYNKIAELVKQEFNYEISFMTVKRFLDKAFSEMSDSISGNPQIKEKLHDVFLDTVKQMKDLNKKLWDLLETMEFAKGRKNIPGIIAVAQEIRKQVELQNKLLGKLHTGTQINIGHAEKVNALSMATMINQYMETMEKKGYITIKKNVKRPDLLGGISKDKEIEYKEPSEQDSSDDDSDYI